jgi:vacuolar-type H+-ATPase subunit B/Vma2
MPCIQKGDQFVTTEKSKKGYMERLEDLIALAIFRNKGQFEVKLRKEIVKQDTLPEEADKQKARKNWYLLMADFALVGSGGEIRTVTKVYAFGDINETGADEKVIRSIANERLKMDYQRFRDAGIEYQEKRF